MKKHQPIGVFSGLDRAIVEFTDSANSAHYLDAVEKMGDMHGFAHKKYSFSHGCWVPINNTGDVVSVLARDDGKVNITWNPSRTSLNEDITLRNHIQLIAGTFFSSLWASECLKEHHLANDGAYYEPDDICCKREHERITQVVSDGKGVTKTVYFGGTKPPSVLYDKAGQMADKWARKRLRDYERHSSHTGDNQFKRDCKDFTPPNVSITRVEERSRKRASPKSLVKHPINPYEKLDFYWYSEMVKSKIVPKLFIDSCHYRGLKPALARIPVTKRLEVEKFLRENELVTAFIDAAPEEIKLAYQKLLILAPERLWKQYVASVPEALRDYRHTGIFTRHFAKVAFNSERPNEQQRKTLNAKYGSVDWEIDLLGKPLTRKLAEKIILAYSENPYPKGFGEKFGKGNPTRRHK